MFLIDLTVQAVKGFSVRARVAFKPGYNVLVPPPEAGAGLSALLGALFYSDGRGSDTALAQGPDAKAAVTVRGQDGRVYRLVRVLGGSGALQRLEPTNTWQVICQETTEINQYLRSVLALPTKRQLDELFCFRPVSFPPLREPATGSPRPSPLAPAAVAAKPALRPNALVEAAMAQAAAPSTKRVDPQRAAKRIERLKAEIAAGQRLDELQYKHEGAQQQIFKLNEQLKKLSELDQKVDELQKGLDAQPTLESLGLSEVGLPSVERYDAAQKKLEEALARAREEEQATSEKLSQSKPQPLLGDPKLFAGLGAGILAFGLGIACRGSQLGYLSLLDIPAFGLAAFCAIRWLGDVQAHEALGRKSGLHKDREQKLTEAFERDLGEVRKALEARELKTGQDLLDLLQRRTIQEQALEEAQADLEAARSSPELSRASSARERLTAEAQALDDEIAQLGGGATRDWHDAERELEELEEALAAPAAPPAPVAPAPPAPTTASAPAGAGEIQREDPTPALLTLAQDLFPGTSLEALGAAIRERAGQYLTALTDRRFQGLQLDGRGQARLLASDRMVSASALEERDSVLLYLAVKLTLLEKYAPSGKPVLVLDEPFAGIEAGKLELLSRMLKQLGAQAQVIHVTTQAAHRAHAAAVLQG